MKEDEEIEVEAVQVMKKSLKLRTVHGQLFRGTLECYECSEPYVIIVTVSTEHGHTARTDIHKSDLASEMKQWLEGKSLTQPMHIVPSRIEDAMNKFIKFGKPPLQEDLLLWVASRCELMWSPETSLKFGGFPHASHVVVEDDGDLGEYHEYIDPEKLEKKTIPNPYQKNVNVAGKVKGQRGSGAYLDPKKTGIMPVSDKDEKAGYLAVDKMLERESGIAANQMTSEELARQAEAYYTATDNTHTLTRGLIGKSGALDELKGKQKAKLTSDHYRLSVEIQKSRKEVQKKMDMRRRLIATSRARQKHTANHYRTIREDLNEHSRGWFKKAEEELLSLQKIEVDIEEDVRRQKNKALRASQKVMWTIAPPGNENRRGKTKHGAYIGPGPLPPDALFEQRDPAVEKTLKKFYWDSEGRRHSRPVDDENEDQDTASIIAHAMEEIRKAAKTLGTHKLDLKRVFKTFDSSGDGFLTLPELAKALLSLNVKLNKEAVVALYHHFDPNDSGSVHYGEFMWAFFNRRDLARKWKRETQNMTTMQIRQKFHSVDKDNSGRLSPKEFAKFLKSVNIVLTSTELDTMIYQFDKDGDGQLDLMEFQDFITRELDGLNFDATHGVAPKPPPSPKALSKDPSRNSLKGRPYSAVLGSRPVGPNGKPRPSSAGAGRKGKDVACQCSMYHYHGTCPHTDENWAHPDSVSGEEKADKASSCDPHWSTNALQHQAEVEEKVGRTYYKA